MTGSHTHIDVEVCRRQSFGAGFERTARDRRLADDLLRGSVTMSPHPEWQVPTVVDWAADPFTQRNWRAQLHMLRWLDPLRRVALDGDDEARALWWEHVRGWLTSDHSHIREFAWMDMIDGVRAKALVLGFPLVPEAERGRYVEALRDHGSWLSDTANRGHSNHALHQLIGLFLVGRLLREEAWWQQAVQELDELFLEQYDEEGINAEGALAYHLLNYRWWKSTLEVLEVEGCSLGESTRRLELARLGIVHATRPDGLMEMIGDTARTPMRDRDSPEMTYTATAGAEGSPPAEVFRAYAAGYVFGRSGWGALETDYADETFYSVAHGTGVKVHGHDEAGAVTYYTRGRPWIVDAGKYAYVRDPFRAYFNSRAAHNVVTLRGERRDKDATVSVVRAHHGPEADDIALLDTGYPGVRIRRRIVFHRPTEALVVIDAVQADREVQAVQQWQIGKQVETTAVRAGFRLASGDRSVRLLWSGSLPEWELRSGEKDPIAGWVSETWMEAQAATQVLATKSGKAFRFVTILAPEKHDDLAVEKSVTLPAGVGLVLRQGGRTHSFSINRDGVRPGLVADADPEDRAARQRALWQPFIEVERPQEVADLPLGTLLALAREEVSRSGSESVRGAWAGALVDRIPASRGLGGAEDALVAGLIDVVGPTLWPKVRTLLGERSPRRLPALGVHKRPAPASGYDHLVQRTEADALSELAGGAEGPVMGSSLAGPLVMPWVARAGEGQTLVVRLHGAVNRTRLTLPVLPGMSSAAGQPQPYLVLQDPALDRRDDLTLAWFAGSPDVDGHVWLASLVEQVRQALGLRDVLAVGSSGGGFTALHLSALLPRSAALAFNPQTDLRAYHRSFADRAALAVLGIPTMAESDDVRVSAVERWERSRVPGGPRAHIVLNTQDELHKTRHVRPFTERVRDRGLGTVSVTEIEGGKGHFALPATEVTSWIRWRLGRQ
ncbi:heparinase II/III family protein [uncultured Serinicoccus sp.]|uniref:heparinase II/III domain-containing protein n=1 Tax=uncultured Serinicoccus sp. TaxID=735514 RepID=UPI00260D67EB|nr:heparinase II/III family protein [uncultured Serinicoccus sp.]